MTGRAIARNENPGLKGEAALYTGTGTGADEGVGVGRGINGVERWGAGVMEGAKDGTVVTVGTTMGVV